MKYSSCRSDNLDGTKFCKKCGIAILSCYPQCEEDLYKVTVSVGVEGLVLEYAMLLRPFNTTILKRDTWRVLACPKGGGQYYKDGNYTRRDMGGYSSSNFLVRL